MTIIDTHAHLDLPEFESDLLEVLQRAGEAGVEQIICAGTTLASSGRCLELAGRFPDRIYASAGIHPNYCAEAEDSDLEEIQKLLRHPAVVAVGETGLDYHHQYSSPRRQREFFRRHIAISLETGKPLIIHSRKADTDALAILGEQSRRLRGVRHCFDSSAQIAAAYTELGLHIAFGGTITREGHKKLKRAARSLPAERLLVETDCPYMAPADVKTGRNEPAFITHTVETLAGLRGTTPKRIAELSSENARRLFFSGR